MKKLILGLSLAMVVLVGVIAPSANATESGHDPAGNNGTVKISNGTPDGIPNNNPHVSCTFYVEFYNYDKGNYHANVDFDLQHPTAGNGYALNVDGDLHPFIGGDAAGGGKDLDASQKYTLAFSGKAHPKQGYHVKLTVAAPGSKGADKKHKVFWVKPCEVTPQILATSTTVNTPTALPNTGAGNVVALFAGVSALAGFGHYIWNVRRVRG